MGKASTQSRCLAKNLDRMVKKEKIGPLETEWFEGATSSSLYPHIDGILDTVTTGGASSGSQVEVYLTEEEVNQGDDLLDSWINGDYMNLVKFP